MAQRLKLCLTVFAIHVSTGLCILVNLHVHKHVPVFMFTCVCVCVCMCSFLQPSCECALIEAVFYSIPVLIYPMQKKIPGKECSNCL